MATITCDVHPWMRAYAGVVAHPFFAVSEGDGKYKIKGLPAGPYTIEIWQEKVGRQTQQVTLADGEAKTVDVELKLPGPPRTADTSRAGSRTINHLATYGRHFRQAAFCSPPAAWPYCAVTDDADFLKSSLVSSQPTRMSPIRIAQPMGSPLTSNP